ncbi:MAG TPA: bifunctional phosphoribosylaminoimidazolecarboxamide formyltransferase/IMP cyclohydrolase [Pyrinomonadaceae bacterium]|nr:bifunctional phosphoribosylaminoimidazolecarboxamide formyltransferase/IMP cyclohydrolase [Chloracidobacterium sp.]MBP9108915.1 bifunctional phosphoribosylaminoimidazolecarboxamide formyltransferase/IMP cyclohydrolase [Pyrinomonadaceae bacterium]MBK7802925.1 bifunctional phosphoribosylaminoimidazolecarboxamide formyltransferase/IMP cyclohydrolase [Chloracidobacterium sp.]MBL0240690.1 bifunctional phosphoribosylaminoimidazolecarboxamide formyltransferase/IMP cyclohydrolase [Chloracidobacterium
MSELRKIKRALLSVSDKQGLADFAASLARHGVEIVSTGGTAKTLRDSGLKVIDVSEVTGFPEMMDGRVKTLHPKMHGAFLALRDNAGHVASMNEHGIEPIDMVVVNLYPFEETIADDGVDLEVAVENIDIGGPAMIRSASKNWRDVAVVTDVRLYDEIIGEMDANEGSISLETRSRLAALAFTRTASYDLAISSYLARQLSNEDLELLEPLNPLGGLMFIEADDEESEAPASVSGQTSDNSGMPEFQIIELAKVADLRYGENPHQRAALYDDGTGGGIAGAEQLHGKEMSFNNYVDAEAAWNLVADLDTRGVAIIKHTNPSGVGIGNANIDAYRRALATDPVSAFGGIVAFNRKVDAEVARSVIEVFSEVIVAPDYDPDALELFKSKKNLRVLRVHDCNGVRREYGSTLEYKQLGGGFLVQDADVHQLTTADLNVVTDRRPTESELIAMQLAWTVCKHVKSNAIVFANGEQTLGVGAGQMNRVDSVRIAAMRAERFNLPLKGSALASDAFFPFRDNVDEAAAFGVSAIIQPGGSIKDDESIAAANEHGIAMAFTGIRHFKH